jgi:hypothetical protein
MDAPKRSSPRSRGCLDSGTLLGGGPGPTRPRGWLAPGWSRPKPERAELATEFATEYQRTRAERPVWSGAGKPVTRTFAAGAVSSGDPYHFRNVEVGGSNPLTSTSSPAGGRVPDRTGA